MDPLPVMGYKTLLLVGSLWLASCATVLNRPDTTIKVYTARPSQIILGDSTTHTVGNRARLRVLRSPEPLTLTVVSDSAQQVLVVKPFNSAAYYANILYNWGLGMLLDYDKPKRYAYPPRLYVDGTNTRRAYYRYRPEVDKGTLLLHLSLPHVNSFYLQPQGETPKASVGFWGFSAGLDDYRRTNRFWSVRATTVTDFFIPFPAPVDISGEWDRMYSSYIALASNYTLKRVTLGYGMCFTANTWKLEYSSWLSAPPPSRDPVTRTSQAVGLYFPAYYRMGEHFFAGLVYRPTVVQFARGAEAKYEHLLSADFAWKIRL